jgi:hypothetical protein
MHHFRKPLFLLAVLGVLVPTTRASTLSLTDLVDPTPVFETDEGTLRFALHFFIEFETLEELFGYIDAQAGRWAFDAPEDRRAFTADLLRRGIAGRSSSSSTHDSVR